MSVQDEIKALELRIENLRNRAVLELKVKLAEARNNVIELERKIAEYDISPSRMGSRK